MVIPASTLPIGSPLAAQAAGSGVLYQTDGRHAPKSSLGRLDGSMDRQYCHVPPGRLDSPALEAMDLASRSFPGHGYRRTLRSGHPKVHLTAIPGAANLRGAAIHSQQGCFLPPVMDKITINWLPVWLP